MNKVFIAAPFGIYLAIPGMIRVKGTYTLNERKGRYWGALTRIWFTKNGIYNRMGMRNPGIKNVKLKASENVVYSISEFTKESFYELLEYIPENIAIELNFSCPNVEDALSSQDKSDILKFASNKFKNVIVKLPPDYISALNLFTLAYIAGIRTFNACNTIKTDLGGKSGRDIQQFSLYFIKAIKESFPDCSMIGGGGIYSEIDIKKYVEAGADAISLGTVFFMPWKLPSVLFGIYKYMVK